jgi:hypothetical protein
LGIKSQTKSPALEKASRTGHPKFKILTRSGRIGIVLDRVEETILWNVEGRATRPLLREGIGNFLSGDVETGKIILRDFINATAGFTKLTGVTHRSAKSLMRMLGPRGNPQARNLFEIVAYLQQAEGVRFEVRSTRAAVRSKKRLFPHRPNRVTSTVMSH